MLPHTGFFAVFIFLIGCSSIDGASDDLNGITISNFKQGEMRKIDGKWTVFNEGEKFVYRNNGVCTVNKKPRECMWVGYSFDYQIVKPSISLNVNCPSPDRRRGLIPIKALEEKKKKKTLTSGYTEVKNLSSPQDLWWMR